MEKEPILWEEMNWQQIEDLVKKVDMVILPVGSIEQHGKHLPLITDSLLCYDVAKRASAKTGVPVLPPIMYGCSQSHGDFPGTLWVRPEIMMGIVHNITQAVYNSGIRKLLILNGHGWNVGALMAARDNVRCDFPDMQILFFNYFDGLSEHKADTDAPKPEAGKHNIAIHANFAETSAVLSLRPDLVQMDKAVNEPACYVWDYKMSDGSKSGVAGLRVTEANEKEGKAIINEAVDYLVQLIRKGLEERNPKEE